VLIFCSLLTLRPEGAEGERCDGGEKAHSGSGSMGCEHLDGSVGWMLFSHRSLFEYAWELTHLCSTWRTVSTPVFCTATRSTRPSASLPRASTARDVFVSEITLDHSKSEDKRRCRRSQDSVSRLNAHQAACRSTKNCCAWTLTLRCHCPVRMICTAARQCIQTAMTESSSIRQKRLCSRCAPRATMRYMIARWAASMSSSAASVASCCLSWAADTNFAALVLSASTHKLCCHTTRARKCDAWRHRVMVCCSTLNAPLRRLSSCVRLKPSRSR